MAHKKSGGSAARQGTRVAGKRLGVKRSQGQIVKPGEIIVRQRGKRISAGKNVALGKDFTLYSKILGVVNFKNLTIRKKAVEVISLNKTTILDKEKTEKE